ncbi:MAG: glycosyltransferase [Flavobacterium sp.]|nr:glycosyltransferase [Flavobacterium sp.]
MLSIIIPLYNSEIFITGLIEQLNQVTYPTIEVLFIDNNSTDNTLEVLHKELQIVQFSYQILSESKQGAGHARNKGIAEAQGEYLAFLDCDDKIHKTKWEKDIAILEKHPVEFVFCRTKRYYEDGREVLHPIDGFIEGINNPPTLGLIWLRHYFYLQGPGAIVIKTEIVKKLGGFHSIKTGEDAFLFIRLGLLYTGFFYSETLFFYFRHAQSTVSKTNAAIDGTVWSYFNLKKQLYADSIVKSNSEAFKIVQRQLQLDLLLLHRAGNSLESIINDPILFDFKRDFLLFNPISLLINRLSPKLKFNPFFQVWKRLN